MSAISSTNTTPPETALEQRIGETSRLVRRVDLLTSLLILLLLLLGGTMLAVLADHWFFKNGLSLYQRFGVFLGLILVALFFTYRKIVPVFLYPINPVYAAHLLEESTPSLKNSIINWFLLRKERLERPEAFRDKLTDKMIDGVTKTAASGVSAIPTDRVVDLRGLVWTTIILAVLLCFAVGYAAFSPKSPLTSLARIMLPFSGIERPQSVQFRNVEPGNADALQGEKLTVSVEVLGQSVEPVYLVFSTDDGQSAEQKIPMALPEGKNRFETPFPPGKQGFSSSVHYWIAQGSSRSKGYRIDVHPTASIEVVSVKYQYPAYTGLEPETNEISGDIRAVEGTEIKIGIQSTLPLEKADLVFDHDPSQTVRMTIGTDATKALGTMTLQLPPQASPKGNVRSFAFRAKDQKGYESRRSGIYRLEVLPDKPPMVQWADTDAKLKDMAQLDMPLNGSLELPIQAEDPDFALRYLRFRVESGDKRIRPVELLESPATGPTKHRGQIKTKTVFSPQSSRLSVGDSADLWVEAVDTKFPDPNMATTRKITVKVIEPQKENNQNTENEKEKEEEPEKNQDQNGQNDQQGEDQNSPSQDNKAKENEQKKDEKKPNDKEENQSRSGNTAEKEDKKENQNRGRKGAEKEEKQENKPGDDQNQGEGGGTDEQQNEKQDGDDQNQGGGSDDKQNNEQQGTENGATNGGEPSDEQGGNDPSRNENTANGKERQDSIDPETQDGDAMDKIVEKMKDDGKFDDDFKEPKSKGEPGGNQKKGDKEKSGTPNTSPEKGNSDQHGEDVPVDPNDKSPRERDDSLDPNSKQRQEAEDRKKELGDRDRSEEREDVDKGKGDRSGELGDRNGKKGDESKEEKGGMPSEEQGEPGEDEQSRNGDVADQKPGQSGQQGEPTNQPGKPSGQTGQQGKPGQQGQPSKNQQQGGKPSPDGEPTGNPEQRPTGGNAGTDDHEEKTETEDPNLEYSKKVTNLVLEYLEDQLKNKPDPKLLDKLGWNEEQLRNFYAKWRKMAEQSQKPENLSGDGDHVKAWKEAFKSLGLTPAADRQTTQKSQTKTRDEKHVTESQRFEPPSAVKDKFKRYTEGISK